MFKITTVNFNKKYHNITYYYKVFHMFLIAFGFNYNFFKFKLFTRLLIKLYCIFLIMIISVATLTCCENQVVAQIWSLLEYVLSTIAILIQDNNISIFFQRLQVLDSYLRIKRQYYYKRKCVNCGIILFVWAVRVVHTTYFCMSYNCYRNLYLFLINLFSLFSLDINRAWRFAMYDEIRYRLGVLRTRLEEDTENIYLYVFSNKCVKENKMKFLLNVYKGIADAMDLMIPELHASVSEYK